MNPPAMTPLERRVYELVQKQGPLTHKQLQEATGCARRSLFTVLRNLGSRGRIIERPNLRDMRQRLIFAAE